jgi:hypothetical protein
LCATVPVFEGYALKHAIISMDYGGQDVSAQLRKLFADKGINVDISTAKFIKEKLAYCSGYKSVDLESTQKEKMTFPLPDGNEVTVDTRIMHECSDHLFVNPRMPSGGLVSQLHESIVLCDDSIKNELAHNIILSGGTSMLPGMVHLMLLAPSCVNVLSIAGFGDKLLRDLSNKFQRETDSRSNSIVPYIRVVPNSQYR